MVYKRNLFIVLLGISFSIYTMETDRSELSDDISPTAISYQILYPLPSLEQQQIDRQFFVKRATLHVERTKQSYTTPLLFSPNSLSVLSQYLADKECFALPIVLFDIARFRKYAQKNNIFESEDNGSHTFIENIIDHFYNKLNGTCIIPIIYCEITRTILRKIQQPLHDPRSFEYLSIQEHIKRSLIPYVTGQEHPIKKEIFDTIIATWLEVIDNTHDRKEWDMLIHKQIDNIRSAITDRDPSSFSYG